MQSRESKHLHLPQAAVVLGAKTSDVKTEQGGHLQERPWRTLKRPKGIFMLRRSDHLLSLCSARFFKLVDSNP